MPVVHVLLAIEMPDEGDHSLVPGLVASITEDRIGTPVASATLLPALTEALEALATWHAKPEDRNHAERHAAADAYHRAADKLHRGGDPVLVLRNTLAEGESWRAW